MFANIWKVVNAAQFWCEIITKSTIADSLDWILVIWNCNFPDCYFHFMKVFQIIFMCHHNVWKWENECESNKVWSRNCFSTVMCSVAQLFVCLSLNWNYDLLKGFVTITEMGSYTYNTRIYTKYNAMVSSRKDGTLPSPQRYKFSVTISVCVV